MVSQNAMYNRNTPLSSLVGSPMTRPPASLRALRGISPGQTPYSMEETAFAKRQQAGQLEDRQATWAAQEGGPLASHSRSPVWEAEIAERLSPSWSAFGDSMAQVPQLAANRGLKGRVDLIGDGPGSGTGVGRWKAQTGRPGMGGSFDPTSASIDLDDLATDTRNSHRPTSSLAMRALQMLMRGR